MQTKITKIMVPVGAFVEVEGRLVACSAVCWLEGEESSMPQTPGEGEW